MEVDLDDETAVVIYETSKLEISGITQATTNIGFPSSVKAPESN